MNDRYHVRVPRQPAIGREAAVAVAVAVAVTQQVPDKGKVKWPNFAARAVRIKGSLLSATILAERE